MVNISSNLKKLLYSNTLPKAGIKISIKKTNKNYLESGVEYTEEEVMSFTEKDITNVNLSQSIDITGAEFPSVKLSWEQNYVGDVDETLRPIDYYGVSEKMAVDFSIIYDYITYVFWKSFYEKIETWKNVYSSSKTWRDVFYSKNKEEVKQKRTFLSSFPVVKNEKIRWESRDLLYFLNGNVSQTTSFVKGIYPVETRDGLVTAVLEEESLRLYNYNENSLTNALNKPEFENIETQKNSLEEDQIFVGVAKDVLRNSLSPINFFIDFSPESGSLFIRDSEKLVRGAGEDTKRIFYLKNQKSNPEITIGSNVSNYIFQSSTFFVDYSDAYYIKPSKIINEFENEETTTQIFITDGPSTPYGKDGYIETDLPSYYLEASLDSLYFDFTGQVLNPIELKLYRIKQKSTTTTMKINDTGTGFEERNGLNPFLKDGSRNFAIERATILSSYYNAKNSKIVINCFGDPSLECGDIVYVETNLKNKDTGENITKKGLLKSMELSYNGAIKETITVHELN